MDKDSIYQVEVGRECQEEVALLHKLEDVYVRVQELKASKKDIPDELHQHAGGASARTDTCVLAKPYLVRHDDSG